MFLLIDGVRAEVERTNGGVYIIENGRRVAFHRMPEAWVAGYLAHLTMKTNGREYKHCE